MRSAVHTRRIVIVLAIGLVIGAPSFAHAADDAAKLKEGRALATTMAAQRKSKDAAGLLGSFKKLVDLHNGLKDKSVRGKLQKELGLVLKSKHLKAVHSAAISTLSDLNDAKGAYKQLKRHMPGPKEEKLSDVASKVLTAVAHLAPDSALPDLYELAEKAKSHDIGAAAITALGRYNKSKKRADVLVTLIKLVRRFQPPKVGSQGGQTVGEAVLKRWEALGQPLVTALNNVTGQTISDVGEWLDFFRRNKKDLENLFYDE